MIIATALKNLFSDAKATIMDNSVTVVDKPIKFGYGDREELNAWIIDQNKKSTPDKYPLVWYLIAPYTEYQGWYKTDATLVIMNCSRLEKMNEWRNTNNYVGVLNPVWKVLEDIITISQKIQVLYANADEKFSQLDSPNFGIELEAKDLKSRENKSTTIDIVDCKIVSFKMRINPNNCY